MRDVRIGGGLYLDSNEVRVKVKRLSQSAVLPSYSRSGDAGLDLTATSMNETNMYIEYGTDLAFVIPEGYVGLIYPRSSLSNYDLILANHVGVIDSNYRGEVKFRFKKAIRRSDNWDSSVLKDECFAKYYEIGDRIGQIIIQKIPEVKIEEVEDLDETNRGTGAYGSSGK